MDQRPVESFLRGESFLQGSLEPDLVIVAAADVRSGVQGEGGALLHGGSVEMSPWLAPHEVVIGPYIPHRPVVGYHITVEAPFIPQDILQKVLVDAARHAGNPVVGGHDGLGLSLPEAALEHRQEVFPQGGFVHVGGGGIAVIFRIVGGEVLGRGHGLQIARILPLDALHIGCGQGPGQERVLPECFVVPSPAGIAAHVHRGAPVVQLLAVQVIQSPHFIGDGGRRLFHKGRIPAVGQGEAHREGAGLRKALENRYHAMGGFVPPGPGTDTQPRDLRCVKTQLADLFLQGHAGNQIQGSFFKGSGSIQIGIHDISSFRFKFGIRCVMMMKTKTSKEVNDGTDTEISPSSGADDPCGR